MRQSRPSPWIATLATFLVGLLACGDDSSSPSDAGSKTDSSVIDAGDGSLDAGSGDARQVTDSASETVPGAKGAPETTGVQPPLSTTPCSPPTTWAATRPSTTREAPGRPGPDSSR